MRVDSRAVRTALLSLALVVGLAPALYARAMFRAPTPPPIALGVNHACGITSAGDAHCWGANDDGQLGDGTTEARAEAVRIGGNLKFQMIAAAHGRTCALAVGGAAYCWGRNLNGEVGNGTVSRSVSEPTAVKGGHSFQQIAVGPSHTCALTTAGATYCWGKDSYGQLGLGSTLTRIEPARLWEHLPLTFSSIAVGFDHSCGLTAEGDAYCWGANTNGQLGDSTRTSTGVPTKVATTVKFSAIEGGNQRTCALSTEGRAYCWGLNDGGMLGDGTIETRLQPTPVTGNQTFTQLSAGAYHTCGLAGGKAFCWGQNGLAQLGDGTRIARAQPVAVAPNMTFTAISAGVYGSCGVTANGETSCWGQDVSKKLTDAGATLTQPTRVAGTLTFPARASARP